MMITRADAAKVHATPNAVMRTLAAPSLGALELSVWEVSMTEGSAGPLHAADLEQVWVVLEGELHFELDGDRVTASAGDSVTLAAGIPRRIHAPQPARALVASRAGGRASTADQGARALPWAQ
jgi:quercetin dioxygenase-like cupin family protein